MVQTSSSLDGSIFARRSALDGSGRFGGMSLTPQDQLYLSLHMSGSNVNFVRMPGSHNVISNNFIPCPLKFSSAQRGG